MSCTKQSPIRQWPEQVSHRSIRPSTMKGVGMVERLSTSHRGRRRRLGSTISMLTQMHTIGWMLQNLREKCHEAAARQSLITASLEVCETIGLGSDGSIAVCCSDYMLRERRNKRAGWPHANLTRHASHGFCAWNNATAMSVHPWAIVDAAWELSSNAPISLFASPVSLLLARKHDE